MSLDKVLELTLDKLFGGAVKYNAEGVVMMHRWTLLKLPFGRSLLVHQFTEDDEFDSHTHPRGFVSLGFRGRYIDRVTKDRVTVDRIWKAPWLRRVPNGHTHRTLLLNRKPCWTLVVSAKL